MPSYKIHSLKDSNKLSFIIEWESEESVKQKLSSEGYIVLSVEKTEIDTKNIFVFEWKKPDKTFIEWKIGADDIFMAYEMLKNQYNYSISKLYPSFITDTHEQEKVFEELLSTFDEKKILTPKVVTDTSSKTLQKNKALIEKIKKILTESDQNNKDDIMSELKKLELINNNSTILQSLRSITKNLLGKTRKTPSIYKKVKEVWTELGIFIPPDTFFIFLEKVQAFFNFISPVFSKDDILPEKIKLTTPTEDKKIHYETIQSNTHIRTLIRKKYQQISFLQILDPAENQSYFYSLFRSTSGFYMLRKVFYIIGYILRMSIFILLLGISVLFFLWKTEELFVFSFILVVFLVISFLSLVIPSETV